jgi:hypothetical protein
MGSRVVKYPQGSSVNQYSARFYYICFNLPSCVSLCEYKSVTRLNYQNTHFIFQFHMNHHSHYCVCSENAYKHPVQKLCFVYFTINQRSSCRLDWLRGLRYTQPWITVRTPVEAWEYVHDLLCCILIVKPCDGRMIPPFQDSHSVT